ncbi:metallophosphoesterase [Burkholderia multivorans]|uniref:metallophosphoesterase n=1 Tax=Burkholderia multivorans TaxID=87883 RepID=UPI000D0166B6|nr:metallophosphoesterase [Burkholderia multivorans]MBN6728714.1 metallophosphoesterase family protein [Burkholderia multivorans]MBN6737662.1 metallophosphoesterase family protein [Burkholderia multivorans]MBN7129108.1 metallophosphoesterase [Burkholderia multivorans]MBN8162430.1 metallophosphoesterase [Burkholderia multivorans]MBN8170185.1 metallophosphoesterase [Burkholderia multivorans]
MKIRVLSDLHLESHQPDTIAHADADLVVLAGDIHNHAEGLRWAAETFDPHVPVVYVPGNHEYYDGEFGALETAMRDAARALDNVHYLNNDVYVDPQRRFRVLGTTLWADFSLFGADEDSVARAIDAAQRVMLDFKGLIQVTWPRDAALHGDAPAPERDFAPADAIALHRRSRAWLAAQLAQPFEGRTIVVTHHAPHRLSLAQRYAEDLASAGFVTQMTELVRPPVALWVHGHTHTSFDYVVEGGTRVVCNPRGYIHRRTGERENAAFAWDKVITLD